jgi:hypothetical protein
VVTFLCTRDGKLVDGGESPWPVPWGFRCNDCGAILPYAVVLRPSEARTRLDEARHLGEDRHRCGGCEGFAEQARFA